MNNDVIIDVKNISKSYKLYDKPIDRLKESLHPLKRKYHKDFYALKNVNFQVKKGEIVGIIGKNGAGKSTLLKIITGVLTPSDGSVTVRGKIASLLELGTGFNPEFTGIENVYLNGTIMGYSKEEIDAKLPAILEFADIGDFVHQPVKLYSSGMYVRLAFSVAINVEPEVLIVDEALAVGDARFQLKCHKRLEYLKELGTTILFVSHAVDQIRTLCSKGVTLDNGEIVFYGDPKEAVVKYLDILFPEEDSKIKLADHIDKEKTETVMPSVNLDGYCIELKPEDDAGIKSFGKGGATLEWLKIYGLARPNVFRGGENVVIRAKYRWDQDFIEIQQFENNLVGDVGFGIALADSKGTYIFGGNNYDGNVFVDYRQKDSVIMQIEFVMPYLKSGAYFLTVAISCGNQKNHVQLKWYDYFCALECMSCKETIFGEMYLDYKVSLL